MKRAAGVAVAAMLLAGCQPVGFERRYGPSPTLDPTALEASSQNHIRILRALAADANLDSGNATFWYAISEAGFNYVDDECRAYFDDLFFLNRTREQTKTELAAASAVTAAIMAVTGSSSVDLAIAAQAFGLAISTTDIVAGTFLFQLPPATTLGFVKELQLAYRDGAAARRGSIDSPAAAYHVIQEYLSLCLPPTIEAKLAEHIAAARAVPDLSPGGDGSSIGLKVVTEPSPTRLEIKALVQGAIIDRPQQQLPAPVPKGKIILENRHQRDISAFQAALCLPVDGKEGPGLYSATSDYLAGLDGTSAPKNKLTVRDEGLLRTAVETVPDCRHSGLRTAYEVGAFGVPTASFTPSKRVQLLQRLLNVPESGKLDSTTRMAIGQYRIDHNVDPSLGQTVDLKFMLAIMP